VPDRAADRAADAAGRTANAAPACTAGAGDSTSGRLRRGWRRLDALHQEFFVGRRSALQREAQRQSDELLTLFFLDSLGVEDPAAYWTLELYPQLVDEFHAWHRRQGRDRLDGTVCC
jgi:hypothetical protein